ARALRLSALRGRPTRRTACAPPFWYLRHHSYSRLRFTRSTAPPSKPPPHPLPGQPPSASVPPINIDISWSCSSSLRETARIFLSHFWGPVHHSERARSGWGELQ